MSLVAAAFLRGLGVVYACAFLSLWVQVDALYGPAGISPVGRWLVAAQEQLGAEAPLGFPSLFWLTGASEWALHGLCALGLGAAVALIAGRLSLWAALTAWASYLSFVSVGSVFLAFQWDLLLLEAGMVGLFAASAEPRLGVWLARALLLKLMFLSGAVKLASGDSTWRDLTALTYHYWSQPLPSPTSVAAAALPVPVQKLSTFLTLAIELGAPWGMLGPRRLRLASAALLAGLQGLIAATGNYGFFNLLTLVLCACLLDDSDLARLRFLARPEPVTRDRLRVPRRVAAGLVAASSLLVACQRLTPPARFPGALRSFCDLLSTLRSVNSYGLFAVMTTERPEIVIEGSADGADWRPYQFRWKPGDLEGAPRFAGPHMPRVDWQMWFAALGSCQDELWFQRFLQRVLEGSRPVTALFARNPFPGDPPRYLRTTLWQYRFAGGEERRAGACWVRSDPQSYCPIVTLRDGHLAAANDLSR